MPSVSKDEVIAFLVAEEEISNTEELATSKGWDHSALVGVIKSLAAESQVELTPSKRDYWKLTSDGEAVLKDGSSEWIVFEHIKANGPKPAKQVEADLGPIGKFGVSAALKNKWLEIDGATKSLKLATKSADDLVRKQLGDLGSLGKAAIDALKKRKFVEPKSITYYHVVKSSTFSTSAKKEKAELTAEMIRQGTWKNETFKAMNFNSAGLLCTGGHLNPLNKVKTEMRNVLLLMGFEEMKTNQWVESSFWNFDSLFQPQQHPARDAHDTFFIKTPGRAQDIPVGYLSAVKEMHEVGGQGSIGWRYDWSEDVARENILRTHTTAVSARTLYQMGQEYQRTGVFTPRKCFSIDRVFRNETLDATHLAEFHQVEGFVADRNLGLGHLIGVLKEFFARIGISDLTFKPAYNPYTEPSMEIFGYHPELKKRIEVGNSGIFRPEMLLPMGLPPDVTVCAWGIGVERWTALLYNVKTIKDLFSFNPDLGVVRKNNVCWLKEAR